MCEAMCEINRCAGVGKLPVAAAAAVAPMRTTPAISAFIAITLATGDCLMGCACSDPAERTARAMAGTAVTPVESSSVGKSDRSSSNA